LNKRGAIIQKWIAFGARLGAAVALAGACSVAQAQVTFNDTFTATTPTTTQTGRLFRDGLPGTCSGKVVPTTADAAAHRFNSYTVQNQGPAACVMVRVTAQAGCTDLPFTVAYTPTFNPAAIQTNYLSDTGLSNAGGDTVSMSFVAPANSPVVIDVHEVSAGVCTYSVQVIGLSNVVPTLSEWGLALVALILGVAGFVAFRRHSR
jgi:hypothetical protein